MTTPAPRIALVTMPFAELAAPSLALLRLKAAYGQNTHLLWISSEIHPSSVSFPAQD